MFWYDTNFRLVIRMKKFRKRLIKVCITFLILFILVIGGAYIYAKVMPKLEINVANSLVFYDQNNDVFFQGNEKTEWVGLNDISKNVINATISAEDKNFYKHKGFDIFRIMKASYVNIRNMKTEQGAYTITQQYAKNLFLDFDKTWKRKWEEALYTIRLEANYSKDEILEGYLNTINYGHGVYGIENASKFYFNKSAKDLDLAEATMLVGIPKSPSNYSPLVNIKLAKKRQKLILSLMVQNKVITDSEMEELANSMGVAFDVIKNKVESLKEFNPMMGHRGCRLDVTYPEIARMQTRAVIEAAINVTLRGFKVIPEIMIPLIGDMNELKYVKKLITDEASKVFEENRMRIDYKVGTMIEIPRATLIADEIASEAEFFSFGTNDLTQLTYGFSRDDASKFLKDYYDKKIFLHDPFQSIDEEGVGKLVDISVRKSRTVRRDIELGICGEHGGDPKSIDFCHRVGLNYVSCSPYRVPVARLAAAQAAIRNSIDVI